MRILVIEDSERLGESLQLGLRRLGHGVDLVTDGTRGLSYARNNPYDVILLDLSLPGLDGISLLKLLRSHGSDTHVLILTARDRTEDRVLGLRAGADDYLTKPFDFDELVARIEALMRRRYGKKDPVMRLGALEFDPAAGELRQGEARIVLSARERSLLEFLGFRRGEVVTRIEIEDALYDEDTLPSGNAVDAAICRLRAKLEQFEGAPVIETRRGAGYVLQAEVS